MNTPVTERPITTTARFSCRCGIRVLLSGEATAVYSDFAVLQERHWDHR